VQKLPNVLDYAANEEITIAMISLGMKNGIIIKDLAKRGRYIASGLFCKV